MNINQGNSSQVWGGFRVARRAKVLLKKDKPTEIELEHSGYGNLGINVRRNCSVENNSIVVKDRVQGGNDSAKAELRLHIHPDISPELTGSGISLGSVCINVEGFHEVAVESYMFAIGFNKSVRASLLRLQLKSVSKLIIKEC